MAIDALHRVDVMRAIRRPEGRIHGLNVQAAVGKLGMACGARRLGFLAVPLMAGKAADPLVDSDGRAIISATELCAGHGRVALIAERLARIGADLCSGLAVMYGGQGELFKGYGIQFAAVKQGQRRSAHRFLRTRSLSRARKQIARAMNLVARNTRNGRFFHQSGIAQRPRPFRIRGCDQVANPAFEMHAMTTQAIIGQVPPLIMSFVQENLRIGHSMRSCRPIRIFLLVASLAPRGHLLYVIGLEMDLFRNVSTQVGEDSMRIFQVES